MTSEEKLERVIAFLTDSHLETYGGYSYDYVECCDVIYVASLDDSKERCRTLIESYRKEHLVAWYDLALAYLKEDEDLSCDWVHEGEYDSFGDWIEAFYETKAAEGVTRSTK